MLRAPLVLLFLALGCSQPDEATVGGPVGSAAARMEGYFPNTVLETHEGKTVRFYDDLLRGRTVLINFMFTSCQGICPLTTSNLVRVQKALGPRVGEDVFLYSITLDPEQDTPKVLKRYAKAVGVGPGWTFLTGERKEIEALRRKLGLYDPDPVIDADMMQHAGLVVYGNESMGRWAVIPGQLSPDAIVKAVYRVMGPKRG
jgi:protein SCO1/2